MLLGLLDELGKALKESIGSKSSPAVGMVVGIITEVPESVYKPALDVRHN